MAVTRFLFKDLSGRGYACKIPVNQVINRLTDNISTEEELTELTQFVEDATEGAEFISASFKLTAL